MTARIAASDVLIPLVQQDDEQRSVQVTLDAEPDIRPHGCRLLEHTEPKRFANSVEGHRTVAKLTEDVVKRLRTKHLDHWELRMRARRRWRLEPRSQEGWQDSSHETRKASSVGGGGRASKLSEATDRSLKKLRRAVDWKNKSAYVTPTDETSPRRLQVYDDSAGWVVFYGMGVERAPGAVAPPLDSSGLAGNVIGEAGIRFATLEGAQQAGDDLKYRVRLGAGGVRPDQAPEGPRRIPEGVSRGHGADCRAGSRLHRVHGRGLQEQARGEGHGG